MRLASSSRQTGARRKGSPKAYNPFLTRTISPAANNRRILSRGLLYRDRQATSCW